MYTTENTAPLPTFGEFYKAINHRDPFPWQERLARRVASDEAWPPEIGIQTGLGKTTCLEIAIWWLASQAERLPRERTAPTRIWWVVNRRLLVDSTAEHAETICTALASVDETDVAEKDAEIIAAIAQRLKSLSADPSAKPLEVIRLRGGVASRTPTDPSQPAVILCTLPMYGSRLLFRGYGSQLRPVDAAMAGTDSLVLLDEAHLAPHLKQLLRALADCTLGASPVLNQARATARLVALTATGDAAPGSRFEIDEEDEAHTIIRRRLEAKKPLELRIEQSGDAAKHLASATEQLLKQVVEPSCCLVFANSPKTARGAFGRIRKEFSEAAADVVLLTGLMREREAEHVRSRVLDPLSGMAANSNRSGSRERHFIVVATQTIEVGADIDAEFLVTEACGVRALTQRLGRLNRRGLYSHARAVYIHLPPGKRKAADSESWPVYGREPADLLKTLTKACGGFLGRAVNLAPKYIANVLGLPGDRPGRAPEVLPALLWEWTKTTTPPEGEAPVEPYFSGISDPMYSVSLVWRAHIPKAGQRLWPRALDHEAIDVPIQEVRETLKDKPLHRIAADGATVEDVSQEDLRPSDQLLLPTDCGLLDEFGWNPKAIDPVLDVSLSVRGLPLDQVAIERVCGTKLGDGLDNLIQIALGSNEDDEDVDPTAQSSAVAEILARLRSVAAPSWWDAEEWAAYIASLRAQVFEPRMEVARLHVANPKPESRSGVLDELSLSPAAVELVRHCTAVAARAKAVAERVGLPVKLCEVVEHAGCFHDIGKVDRRFQRWLDPEGSRGALVAKSGAPPHMWEAMRVSAGWPRGGRHEDLSCRLVRELLDENIELLAQDCDGRLHRDLLLHLVMSHHGNGRPLVLPVNDGTLDTVSFTAEGRTVRVPADLEIVDWEQPNRFRRLNDYFGPWGLALIEATLIRSDHAVSGGAEVIS